MSDSLTVGRTDKRTYLIGFAFAVVLTVIPFAIVYWQLLPANNALLVIAVAAIAQIVIQLRFFLHVDFVQTPRENIVALLFAGFLILVMVGGSLWIMLDLRYRHHPELSAIPATTYVAKSFEGVADPSLRDALMMAMAIKSMTSPTSKVSATLA